MAREVITLQIGSIANYVGAHYWNLEVHKNRNPFCRATRTLSLDCCAGRVRAPLLLRRQLHRRNSIQRSGDRSVLSVSTGPDNYVRPTFCSALKCPSAMIDPSPPHLSGRPTITPRLLAFDLTGALGSMPDAGYLNAPPKIDTRAAQANWCAPWQTFVLSFSSITMVHRIFYYHRDVFHSLECGRGGRISLSEAPRIAPSAVAASLASRFARDERDEAEEDDEDGYDAKDNGFGADPYRLAASATGIACSAQ